jgi:hypothetical protein
MGSIYPGSSRREDNHANAQKNKEFVKNMTKFANGNSKSGGKPQGHLKSDARRDGGTHKR